MQQMFSVYIHCPPDFSYAPGNLFAGYEVPQRVPVTWGQWSVVCPSPHHLIPSSPHQIVTQSRACDLWAVVCGMLITSSPHQIVIKLSPDLLP